MVASASGPNGRDLLIVKPLVWSATGCQRGFNYRGVATSLELVTHKIRTHSSSAHFSIATACESMNGEGDRRLPAYRDGATGARIYRLSSYSRIRKV